MSYAFETDFHRKTTQKLNNAIEIRFLKKIESKSKVNKIKIKPIGKNEMRRQ